jgi:hypothetical protein
VHSTWNGGYKRCGNQYLSAVNFCHEVLCQANVVGAPVASVVPARVLVGTFTVGDAFRDVRSG